MWGGLSAQVPFMFNYRFFYHAMAIKDNFPSDHRHRRPRGNRSGGCNMSKVPPMAINSGPRPSTKSRHANVARCTRCPINDNQHLFNHLVQRNSPRRHLQSMSGGDGRRREGNRCPQESNVKGTPGCSHRSSHPGRARGAYTIYTTTRRPIDHPSYSRRARVSTSGFRYHRRSSNCNSQCSFNVERGRRPPIRR